ncbi:hypothetical protein CR513_28717, partial [Mucuna pruriens]
MASDVNSIQSTFLGVHEANFFLILSMIIPNMYLQPLMKELNELWIESVETYDSSLKELFRMVEYLYWICLPNLLMKKHFDSTIEERDAPKLLSRLEILKQLDDINVTFESNLESNIKGNKNCEEDGPKQWKKKSIFFNLPY